MSLLSRRRNLFVSQGDGFNLLAKWLMDNNVLDSSGNGYDGTLTGGSYVNNRKSIANSALQLASGDFLDTPLDLDDLYPSGTDFFSYSLWVKFNSLGLFKTIISSIDSQGAIYLEQRNASLTRVVFRSKSGLGGLNFDKDYNLGFNTVDWFHIVITAEILGTGFLEVKIYKGVYGSSPTSLQFTDNTVDFGTSKIVHNTTTPGLSNFGFGDLRLATVRPLDGILDDIRMYNSVLDLDKIIELYNE